LLIKNKKILCTHSITVIPAIRKKNIIIVIDFEGISQQWFVAFH